MKLFVLSIILLSLYLIYRLSFPKQSNNRHGSETFPFKPAEDYEAVIKNRFVLPAQSNATKHEDKKENPDKQDEKANIFASGNDNPKMAVIPADDLDEVFGEDINPEELDIEPEENETEWDADEEEEEIRQSMGKMEGYAEGFTYDEFEKLVSSDQGKALRIASILDRSELSLSQDSYRTDDTNPEYEKFDIGQFLVE